MKKAFKWGSMVFALIPGLSVIAKYLPVPPGISHLLLGGIIEAFGVFTLIILNVFKSWFDKAPPSRVVRIAVVFFSLFFIALVFYLFLNGTQVVYSKKYNTSLLIPFKHGDDLNFMLSHNTPDPTIIDNFGPQQVKDAIAASSPFDVITQITFMVLYVGIFEFLTLGFGFVGSKKQSTT